MVQGWISGLVVAALVVPAHADPWTAGAQASYTWTDLAQADGSTGGTLALTGGYHTDPTTVVGLRVSVARTNGTYSDAFTPPTPYNFLVVVPAAYAHGEAIDTLWADVYVGMAIDGYRLSGMDREWTTGVCLGLVGGIDVLKLGKHRLSVTGQVESELSGASHETLALGVAYRIE